MLHRFIPSLSLSLSHTHTHRLFLWKCINTLPYALSPSLMLRILPRFSIDENPFPSARDGISDLFSTEYAEKSCFKSAMHWRCSHHSLTLFGLALWMKEYVLLMGRLMPEISFFMRKYLAWYPAVSSPAYKMGETCWDLPSGIGKFLVGNFWSDSRNALQIRVQLPLCGFYSFQRMAIPSKTFRKKESSYWKFEICLKT